MPLTVVIVLDRVEPSSESGYATGTASSTGSSASSGTMYGRLMTQDQLAAFAANAAAQGAVTGEFLAKNVVPSQPAIPIVHHFNPSNLVTNTMSVINPTTMNSSLNSCFASSLLTPKTGIGSSSSLEGPSSRLKIR